MSKTKPVETPAQPETIWTRLAAPFPDKVLGWKPQIVTGNRCLAIAYIDARDVMDRLDAVIGPENWTDSYNMLDQGCVLCRLQVRVGAGAEWLVREDVGGPSDQKDVGDKLKAAVSDSLKRAAVKFGIGRYIYALEPVWCGYDPQKKQIIGTPQGVVQMTAEEPARQTGESPDYIKDSPTMMARIKTAAAGTGLTPKQLAAFCGLDTFNKVEAKDFQAIMDGINRLREQQGAA